MGRRAAVARWGIADIAFAVVVAGCLAGLAADASVGLPDFRSEIEIEMALVFAGMLVTVAGLLVFAAACMVILVSVFVVADADKLRSRRRAVVAAAVVAATLALAWGDVPVRIAFWASSGAFDELAAAVPPAAPGKTMPLYRQAGLYGVDAHASDAAGGRYFRVGSSSLLDTTSWGFCRNPHPDTSPFGAAGYSTTALGGGWHWFTANNDW